MDFYKRALAPVSYTHLDVYKRQIFARCEFRFKKAFFYVLLITRMSPGAVFVIPYFIAYKELGLLDTYIGLTPIYFASNLGIIVWSLRAFMEDIPISLEAVSYTHLDVYKRQVLRIAPDVHPQKNTSFLYRYFLLGV